MTGPPVAIKVDAVVITLKLSIAISCEVAAPVRAEKASR